MPKPKAPKTPGTTMASAATITLGMVTIPGKLKTVRTGESKKAAGMRTICPACLPVAEPVVQQYTCVNQHGPFFAAECAKAKEVDGELVPFTGEDVAAVRAAPEESDHTLIELEVYPADQAAPYSRQTGVAYFFDAGPGTDAFVGLLRDLVSEPDWVFMAEIVVRGVRRWMRLQAAPHGLELVELARPEQVFVYEARELPYPSAYLATALQLAEAAKRDFDPERFRDGAAERLAAVLEAKAEGQPVATVTSLPKAAAADTLETMLSASLAVAREQAA